MKKIALFCVICLLLTVLPGAVSADSDVSFEVSNITDDIVTVSGSVPTDKVVTIIILKPGVDASNLEAWGNGAGIQFMDVVPTYAGKFKKDIKMNTGTAPNKTEGAFTVLLSVDGKYIYKNNDFLFYSNETKVGYVSALRDGTKEELLAGEGEKLLETIFKTYSLADHQLYKESDIKDLATVICAQDKRENLQSPSDVGAFLLKALVLCAFDNKSTTVVKDNEISYAEVWAADSEENYALYAERYVNDLNAKGKKAVSDAMRSKNYGGAQFGDIFDEFAEKMYYNLIKNNSNMGTGHIEKLILDDFNAQYEAAGFDTELLDSITNVKEKSSKITKFSKSTASNLSELADDFNDIMKSKYTENSQTSGGGGGGGGASSGGGGKVPSSSTGGGFVDETPTSTPAPTTTPAPSSGHSFKDMADAQWANEAVEYLYSKGVINGRNESTFAPNETVSRAELVKMIVEALDVQQGDTAAEFGDVNDGDWFAVYVKKAASAGIVNGDGGSFRPNGGVTREDAALIIFRALRLENGGEVAFSDAGDIAPYAKDAIAAMVNSGYINGMGDGTFAPKATLTRAQAAQLIYNALTKGGDAA